MMWNFLQKICLLGLVASTISACSKTVRWEEEVLLNTGETIWVKRTDTFKRGSEPGNPLQMTWGPKSQTVEFTWHGQNYEYQSTYGPPIMIYVLGDAKAVVLVGGTNDCDKPGYGEFRWINGRWQLQENVSSILIGQPRNLMDYYSATDGDIPARVSKEFKHDADTLPNRGKRDYQLPVEKIAKNCKGSK